SLMAGLVDGLVAKAQAQTSVQPRNLVAILYNGGPTRWAFDNFLKPHGSADAFINNPCVSNYISTTGYEKNNAATSYQVEPVDITFGATQKRSIYLAPLWNRTIPAYSNGQIVFIPMSSLLDNAMIIRGVHMQVDIGHGTGPTLVTHPVSTLPSISGLVADQSNRPLSAVGIGDGYGYNLSDAQTGAFYSSKGTGISLLRSGGTPLPDVLDSFTNGTAVNKSKLASLRSSMNDALLEMSQYASSGKPGADALYKMRNSAENMFYRSFGDLTAVYDALYTKYDNLEQQSAISALPNLIPSNIASVAANDYNAGNDLPSQFAVAEFLLMNDLSSSITMTAGSNTKIGGLFNYADEHEQDDRQVSVITANFRYRALAAMIYELRRSLGAARWENTVVEVSAEYDRSPRKDMTGSDHAPEANTMSVFSGAIKQPLFIGNIAVQSRDGDYTGTWGAAAPVAGFADTPTIVTNENVASTLCSLLNVTSPFRAASLISTGSTGIVSLAEEPKNVA
ncbi:MAG: hypothetical protein ACXWRZ_17940, partial [Bdellovibrio sp.]